MRTHPPLSGITAVEFGDGLAVRTAGALLADLGVRVLRLPPAEPAAGGDARDPSHVWSDRRKVTLSPGRGDRDHRRRVRRLLDRCDVVLTDEPAGRLSSSGLDAVSVARRHPRVVHAWLPPLGADGPGSHLAADHLLLAAASGYADHYPCSQDRPVAPVVPTYVYLHGAMAAAAVVAGLVGRELSGTAAGVRVSGFDAMAAALGTLMMTRVDPPAEPSPRWGSTGAPNFRLYRAGDGAWFYLAALTPGIFVRALDAVGRIDLLVRDDVAGEFANILLPGVREQVNAELEATFATAPAAAWLDILRAADVPAAPVWSREEWLAARIVPAAARCEFEHPDIGTLQVPVPPVAFPETPMLAGGSAPATGDAGGIGDIGEIGDTDGPELRSGGGNGSLPLAGVTVVDIASFVAGPFVSSLLADFGADVIRVEPVDGDPYSVYAVSHAVVNQHKRMVNLDLRDEQARDAFLTLVGSADLLVDNFMPESLDRLGLTAQALAAANPQLVRCSVSAFGADNDWSGTPGFDPVLQSMTGLAVGQGGRDAPAPSSAPVVDTATGSLGALGALAALYVRCRTGRPQHVRTSLAAGAVFVQSAELTSYAGRPAPPPGEPDCLGFAPSRRLYETADGWIAVAATTGQQEAAFRDLAASTGPDDPDGPDLAFTARGSQEWLDELAASGVPAVAVLPRSRGIVDPALCRDGFSHLLDVPGLGRYRIVRSYSAWDGERRPPGRAPLRGRDTLAALTAAGVDPQVVEELIARGTAVDRRAAAERPARHQPAKV